MSEEMKYKAPDEDRMDDLFRETMKDYRVEPDPGLWKGISRKLLWQEIRRFNFSNVSTRFWVAGIVAVLLTGAGIIGSLTVFPPAGKPAEISVSTAAPAVAVLLNSEKTPVGGFLPRPVAHALPASNKSSVANRLPAQIPADGSSAGMAGNVAEQQVIDESTGSSAKMPKILSPDHFTWPDISFMQPIDCDYFTVNPAPDTMITVRTMKGNELFVIHKSPSRQMLSASIGVNPEVAFYKGSESYTKMNYWFQAGVAYHISRFSISSGAGLGYMLDNGKYKVDYKSKDSIGYYASVISYVTGSNNEISYTTKTYTIYDSLQHSTDYRTADRYTYLRIPLLFGYRLFESNRISLTIQAGPAISFLLGSRKSDPVIDYTNARIIRIGDETPSRLKTNWQLWANLNFEMKITRKISLYLEPSFKYFMKPTAEQENTGAVPPWSLGLGVGLQFNFEPKKQTP